MGSINSRVVEQPSFDKVVCVVSFLGPRGAVRRLLHKSCCCFSLIGYLAQICCVVRRYESCVCCCIEWIYNNLFMLQISTGARCGVWMVFILPQCLCNVCILTRITADSEQHKDHYILKTFF